MTADERAAEILGVIEDWDVHTVSYAVVANSIADIVRAAERDARLAALREAAGVAYGEQRRDTGARWQEACQSIAEGIVALLGAS